MTRNVDAPFRLFVSFARTSDGAVARLISHLELQTWQVWNYAKPSASVPVTSELESLLRSRLMESNVFVALVTEAAFSNEFTKAEVRWALQRYVNQSLEMAVFVDAQIARTMPDARSWPEPYDALRRFRFAIVDFDKIVSIGDAVAQLCQALDLRYVPYLAEKGRVLLLSRFYTEMLNAAPLHTARENDVFAYLVRLLEATHQALAEGDEEQATQLLQLSLLYTQKEYPNVRLHYGRIIHALHQARAGQVREGLATLLAVKSERTPVGPSDSGLLPAAMGYCYYQLGDYRTALDKYELAFQSHDADVATASNVLLCRLRLGQRIALPDDFDQLERARHYPADGPIMQFTKAIAYRLNRQYREAFELLEPLIAEPPKFPPPQEILEECARTLKLLGQNVRAESILRSVDPNLARHPRILRALAKTYRDIGRIEEARRLWFELVGEERPTAESFFEAIVGLWNSGARDVAIGLSLRFLEQVPWPGEPFAFYVAGMAQWILGNRERAEYDLLRSGKSRHYLTLLAP